MTYRTYGRRLAALEALEAARRVRVLDRVLALVTDDDLNTLIAFSGRHEANPRAEPTPAERDALQRIDGLVRADVEGRPADCTFPCATPS